MAEVHNCKWEFRIYFFYHGQATLFASIESNLKVSISKMELPSLFCLLLVL